MCMKYSDSSQRKRDCRRIENCTVPFQLKHEIKSLIHKESGSFLVFLSFWGRLPLGKKWGMKDNQAVSSSGPALIRYQKGVPTLSCSILAASWTVFTAMQQMSHSENTLAFPNELNLLSPNCCFWKAKRPSTWILLFALTSAPNSDESFSKAVFWYCWCSNWTSNLLYLILWWFLIHRCLYGQLMQPQWHSSLLLVLLFITPWIRRIIILNGSTFSFLPALSRSLNSPDSRTMSEERPLRRSAPP